MQGPGGSHIVGAKVALYESSGQAVESKAVSWLSRLRMRWWMGMLYVVTTLYGSASFLSTASIVVVNDLFWSKFNATTSGVFVADAFNSMLAGTHSAMTLQLTDAIFAQLSTESVAKSTIQVSPHYARQLQYDRLTGIEDAVIGLRKLSGAEMMLVFTQYCWIDFGRQWSLAHTEQRAERCWRDHATNSAVYLESLLRNIRWEDFEMAWGYYFASAIEAPLMELAGGATFLEQVKKNGSVAIVDEVRYWQEQGMTHHTLQYHNIWQLGVDEKIEIINAFGVRTLFTIKKTDYVNRWAIQTTIRMNWGIANDLWATVDNNTAISGMSLIRNSTNFYEKLNVTMEQVLVQDGNFQSQFTPGEANFRAAVGPYGSIDMIWTKFPPELFELVNQAKAIIMNAALTTSESRSAFAKANANSILTLAPKVWMDGGWTFVNGNPLCSSAYNVNYVLQQFAFGDGCQAVSDGMDVGPMKLVFAALVSNVFDGNNTDSVCRSGTQEVEACTSVFDNAVQFVRDFIPIHQRQLVVESAKKAHAAITALNISLIQFVYQSDDRHPNNTLHAMLMESVLSLDREAKWNAFGWFLMLDWVLGLREVVSFQGDRGKLTILSALTTPSAIAPNTAELTTSTAFYLLLSMQYVTAVLVFVAVVVLAYAITVRFAVAGSNLFKFNRVAGIVWVGRPMLFLRGVVAMCILSTARPELVFIDQLVWMEDLSTSWINSLLTAGEATWLLYIALDVLLVCFGGHFYYVAQTSNIVTFLAVAVLQIYSPTSHKMVIDRKCEYVVLDHEITCIGGSIYIGSSTRFASILAITAISALGCFVVVRYIRKEKVKPDDCHPLPGVVQEMFTHGDWIYEGSWYVDRASAAMAGLLSRRSGSQLCVFNVSTWSLWSCDGSNTRSDDNRFERAICLRGLKSPGKGI